MELARTETIAIGGHDLRDLVEYMQSLPTLTKDEADALAAKYGRLYHQGSSPGGKTTDGARLMLQHLRERGFRPLDPPSGMNRAQRRARAKAQKNR